MQTNSPFLLPARWHAIALLLIAILGLAVRFYDLTDPPLEDAYRQLHSAIIARGFFYRLSPSAEPEMRAAAIEIGRQEDIFEPPLFEWIVALTYRLIGQEVIWTARVYAILFWLVGGLGVYGLARRIASPDGALAAFAFYWIGPWGIVFSRNFQPDGLMVMLTILAALALDRWAERRSGSAAITAGLACGLAALVKIFAALFVGAMAIAVVLSVASLRQALKDRQVWGMAGIMVAIPSVVYLGFRPGAAGYFSFWGMEFIDLVLEPFFYLRWLEMIQAVAGSVAMAISLVGVLLLPARPRFLMTGWWLGYILYGLAVPWQIHTHEYYNVIVIPLIALGLAPVAALILRHLALQPKLWKLAFLGVSVVSLLYPAWNARVGLARAESRSDWKAWTRIGQSLPKTGEMIALDDTYGLMIRYFGMRTVEVWPTSADYALMAARQGNLEGDFEQLFARLTQGKRYFLVTAFHELDQQPELKAMLYGRFPIYAQGDGYILFDLLSPIDGEEP
jgi:4-amino-4-deoxy-L-arabinose transferase-like glycosyltransferase